MVSLELAQGITQKTWLFLSAIITAERDGCFEFAEAILGSFPSCF
jgi:hypothetical protein